MTHIEKGGPSVEPDEDGHLHTYVFVNHSDTKIPVLLDGLVKYRRDTFPRVWWAGSAVGDYLALIHIEASGRDDLAETQQFLETRLWDEGVHCLVSTVIAAINKLIAKHSTPDVLGLVGIKTVPGRTMAVAQQLAEKDAEQGFTLFQGGSVLTGDLDILLQVNGASLTAVHERLFPLDPEAPGLLDDIDDIVSTSTAVTDGRRGPFSAPPPEELYIPKNVRSRSKSGGSKPKSKGKTKPKSKSTSK
jgi:hypothetical protein